MRVLIVLVIACFSLKVCVLVQGRYLVQVRLNGYSNPTGMCGNGSACRTSSGQLHCCDSHNTRSCSGGERCDSYFIYCLRPLGEVQLSTSRCSSDQITSSTNHNDGPLDFSQSKVLDLDNPLYVSGLQGAYNGVQLYIEIKDNDYYYSDDEVVDILLVNLSLTAAESLRKNHTGIYNLVTMDLAITVLCVGNFGGSDCTQCVPGFTGTNCNRRHHCFGVNCSGRGYCINNSDSFTCVCDSGYGGRLCENIDCSTNTCNENGICVDDINSPSCSCNAGFTGRVCEIDIDDCLSSPCGENGQCMDRVNSHQCTCDPGFTGKLCQTNIDDCDSVGMNCSGNGRCLDGVNSFQCTCDPGFTGDTCQTNIDNCVGVNCSGNGQCMDGVNSFTCECTPGFSGLLCSSEVDMSSESKSNTSDNNIGAIVGGIVGALLAVVILLILIIMMFMIISKCQHKNFKLRETNCQGNGNSAPMPGDNPVYEPGYTINGDSLSQTMTAVTTFPEGEGNDSSVGERKFDNPIYGDGETDDSVYTAPFDQQDQQSLPSHEFDNPIYGTETYDS